MSEIVSKFYRLKPKNIIAVTGTNGKTSVADFFYQILTINKIPASYIGTLGIKYNKKVIKMFPQIKTSEFKENIRNYFKKYLLENTI